MGVGGGGYSEDEYRRAQLERQEAPELLARILSEEFGAEITGLMVETLIRKKWWRVQQLAHYVHDRVSA